MAKVTKYEIEQKGYASLLLIVKLYNAHAYFDRLSNALQESINESTGGRDCFTESEASEILAIADSAMRDILDD